MLLVLHMSPAASIILVNDFYTALISNNIDTTLYYL